MSVITDAENYLKDVLLDGINEEYRRKHPLLNSMNKVSNLGALANKYNVQYGAGQGTAHGNDSIGKAQTYSTQSKSVVFNFAPSITEVEAILPLTELEIALQGSRYAFGSLIEAEVDSKWESIIVQRGRELFRGNNTRGQISAISSNTVTLTFPTDVVMIEVGMTINLSVNSDGSSPQTGQAVVLGVDEGAGTFLVDNLSGISGAAVNMWVFSAPEIGQLTLEGLAVSTPLSAPSVSDSFRGVNRSLDAFRLAGARLPSTSKQPVEQGMLKLAARMSGIGADGDFAVCSPNRGAEWALRSMAKLVYMPGEDNAAYGFMGFRVMSQLGPLEVVIDPDCPDNSGWIGYMPSHEISTVDEMVRFSSVAGYEDVYFYPKPANSQIAVRMRSVAQYRQIKPRDFGALTIS